MGLSLILPMSNGACSRARFFHSHGVTLESQARSRSGVREDDGTVVFALPVAQVRVDAWGCSCLLWADRGLNDAVSVETLRHCKLALRHGVAEGFLLGRDHAALEPQELLAVRVIKAGREYWAKWGRAARAETGFTRARDGGTRCR
jgi:hypothetical protein